MLKSVSPSRTYLILCIRPNHEGYYFRELLLPDYLENNSEKASWYFLNYVDGAAYIEGAITLEDGKTINDCKL